jgi:hypothetical protein
MATPPEPPERSGANPSGGRPARGRRAGASGAPTAPGGGTQQTGGGAPPATPATSLTAGTLLGNGCGDRTGLTFLDPPPDVERIPVKGIEGANLRTAGDAYYEGMLERIGAFRAIDELVARFLGGLNITSAALRNKLCNYMRQEPLRVPRDDRYPVLSLFGDATLERLLLRLSDAVVAFDLSARSDSIALVPAAVPQAAARLALIAAIEDLALLLDAKGGGGVCYVTNEVGRQLSEILQILDSDDLRPHVPGNDVDDVFSIIQGLLPNAKDLPSDLEARQLARKASAGRRLVVEISTQVFGAVSQGTATQGAVAVRDPFDGDLSAIGGFIYEWRAAHGGVYIEGVDDCADGQAADDNRLKVIRLRAARAS